LVSGSDEGGVGLEAVDDEALVVDRSRDERKSECPDAGLLPERPGLMPRSDRAVHPLGAERP
jgi:hypothetical protein